MEAPVDPELVRAALGYPRNPWREIRLILKSQANEAKRESSSKQRSDDETAALAA